MSINLKEKASKFLRWSQKYTKTDMVYLARGGFWLTLNQVGGTAIAWLLAVAWANLAPKELYGEYSFIHSIISILLIFSLSEMGRALTQTTARGNDLTIKEVIKQKFKWSFLGTLASWGISLYYYVNYNETLFYSFLIVGIIFPLLETFAEWASYLKGKKRFDLFAKYSNCKNLINLIVIAITLAFTRNIIIIIAVYLTERTLSHLLFYKITLKKAPPQGEKDRKAVKYGKQLTLVSLVGQVATYIDKILIFHFLGAAEVAIYSFSVLPVDKIKSLFKSLETLALPKFSKRKKGELGVGIKKKAPWILGALVATLLLYIIFANLIFKIFFPQYLEAVYYTKIYSFSILGSLFILLGAALYSQKEIKKIYKHNLVTNLLKIILLFLGVYFWGLLGIIVAQMAIRILSGFYLYILVKR